MTTAPVTTSKLGFIEMLGRRPKLYDLLAASPLIIWCILCLFSQWGDLRRDVMALHPMRLEMLGALDFVSRLLRFAFAGILGTLVIVRRTPIKKHEGLLVRVIVLFGAYGGIAAQVFPVSPTLSPWLIGSTALTIGGTSFAIFSLLWLGRSISIMPESRKLMTTGPYSIIRHPLYFGEQTAIVGIALQSGSLWVATILVVQTICQIYRMRCEEEVLSESFPEYKAYRAKTAFIIPWLY
ncbi:MAG TPA: isoprenylcysteine carboxylmethyltransferase family protein [Rhizomicrobium sp.]